MQASCHQLTMPLAGVGAGGGAGGGGCAKLAGPGSSGPLGFALKQAVMHMHGEPWRVQQVCMPAELITHTVIACCELRLVPEKRTRGNRV